MWHPLILMVWTDETAPDGIDLDTAEAAMESGATVWLPDGTPYRIVRVFSDGESWAAHVARLADA